MTEREEADAIIEALVCGQIAVQRGHYDEKLFCPLIGDEIVGAPSYTAAIAARWAYRELVGRQP